MEDVAGAPRDVNAANESIDETCFLGRPESGRFLSFQFELRDSLPKLAWGAVVTECGPTTQVYHGGQIKILKNGFGDGSIGIVHILSGGCSIT